MDRQKSQIVVWKRFYVVMLLLTLSLGKSIYHGLNYGTIRTFHTALGTTPFKVDYGRNPPSLLKFKHGSTTNFELEAVLRDRDAMLSIIKHHLIHAQDRMKNNADKHRRELVFNVGDLVSLKPRPYRQQSVIKRLYQKLAARYYGPYEVLARVRTVTYLLNLPPVLKIHNVFHVSQLKPVLGSQHEVSSLPTSFTVEEEVTIAPEAMLDTRYDAGGNLEALISWSSLPTHETTWEKVAGLLRQFPSFESKLSVAEGDIDKPLRVYTRRKLQQSSLSDVARE